MLFLHLSSLLDSQPVLLNTNELSTTTRNRPGFHVLQKFRPKLWPRSYFPHPNATFLFSLFSPLLLSLLGVIPCGLALPGLFYLSVSGVVWVLEWWVVWGILHMMQYTRAGLLANPATFYFLGFRKKSSLISLSFQ